MAADEPAAKDLLLSLMPEIEQTDRDDLQLETLAQLGELYLVRTAYDGVREGATRIRECLAAYLSILDGTATPEVVAKSTMTDADARHLICRYSRRAQFLQIGLAAALGDHEGAAAALEVLDGMTSDDAAFADLRDEYAYLCTYARINCATALCDDDLHVRSVPLWQRVIADIDGPGNGSESTDNLLVLGGIGYARFCIETGALDEAEPWLRRAGARAEARKWPLAIAEPSWSVPRSAGRGANSWPPRHWSARPTR